MNSSGVLVVGSSNHPLAEKCINWGDNFYVGDYEIIIFNLPSLDRGEFLRINSRDDHYFFNIRDQLVESQEKTNLIIICITDKMFVDGIHLVHEKKINNYTWCPIIPIFEENGGKKIPQQKRNLKIQYLNLVKEWELLLDKHYNNTGYDDGNDWGYTFKVDRVSYLYNNLKRDISFGFNWSISSRGSLTTGSKKPIIFLPKISDIKHGIDLLLNDFTLQDDPEPNWIQEITIAGQEGLEKKVKEEGKEIERLEELRNKSLEEIKELNKFKKLLYLQGKPLEKIVEESLLLLGVPLKKLVVDNLEDRVFEYDNFTIPFEIRGKDTKGLNETDLAQLIKRIADRETGEKYKTRGVFIINHQRNLKPEGRGEVCNVNITKKAESFNICILSTMEIFNLINKSFAGEKINIKEKLFNTLGLFNFAN